MPGQRRLHRDLRRLQVADLAHHDDIGVLAQDGAQQGGEVEPDLRLNLDLVDAAELILDRVLDGDDLARDRVERQQPGVERGGLAAAGRAGDQHDPVGQSSAAFQAGDDGRSEAELVVVERHGAAVEHAQHDGLAVQRGNGGHAEVDLRAAHGQLDAAVLRQAALGDVQPGHDLDARGDGRGQSAGGAIDLVQHAVVAVAHAQPVLEGLEMDVGRLGLHRAGDDLVDQADHRRLAGQILQALGVLLQRLAEPGSVASASGGSLRVQAVERRVELDRDGDLQSAPAGRWRRRRPRRETVQRIGGGQHQRRRRRLRAGSARAGAGSAR